MNFLLSASGEVDISKPIEGFGDKLLYGGQTLLIGMATVFSVLILLWLALTVFKLVFTKRNTSEKTETTPAPIAAPVVTANDDEEIVAVIAAAIAMAESESSGVKFRVVSFKRK